MPFQLILQGVSFKPVSTFFNLGHLFNPFYKVSVSSQFSTSFFNLRHFFNLFYKTQVSSQFANLPLFFIFTHQFNHLLQGHLFQASLPFALLSTILTYFCTKESVSSQFTTFFNLGHNLFYKLVYGTSGNCAMTKF